MGQADKQFQSQCKENQLVLQDDSQLASYQKIEHRAAGPSIATWSF